MQNQPVIQGLSDKVLHLERRRNYLDEQIKSGRGSAGSLQFARAEQSALSAAIDALMYHRAVVNGLDTPLSALRELVDSCTEDGKPDAEALERARIVLDEFKG